MIWMGHQGLPNQVKVKEFILICTVKNKFPCTMKFFLCLPPWMLFSKETQGRKVKNIKYNKVNIKAKINKHYVQYTEYNVMNINQQLST